MGDDEGVHVRESRSSRFKGRRKLLVGEKVEIRSLEDGFLGSWHEGTVVECSNLQRRVRYDHLVDERGSDLIDTIAVRQVLDGKTTAPSNQCNYRGLIRPTAPPLEFDKSNLSYGLCVDVYFQEAWWEGVIFDHKNGAEERMIFFPDLGDDMTVKIDSLRITQDWDELTESWHHRGTWVFLELIENAYEEHFVPVSIKQIWYDLREKKGFEKIGEWTSYKKNIWEGLIVEVISDYIKIIVNHFLHPSSKQEDDHLPVDFNKSIDSMPLEDLHDGESDFYPEVVEEYAKISPQALKGKKTEVLEDMRLKVRKHLVALGWDISIKAYNRRRVLQYVSPKGATFSTLRKACIRCIKEQGLKSGSTCLAIASVSDGRNADCVRNAMIQKNPSYSIKYRMQDSSDKQSKRMLQSKNEVQDPHVVVSWLIEKKVVLPSAKIYYYREKDKFLLGEGILTQDGIKCNCCDNIYDISKFESHIGNTDGRPAANIVLEDGRSLLDCQVQANMLDGTTNKYRKDWKEGNEENDFVCSVCHYGGDLILCDGCPSSFHNRCLGLKDIPDGDWFCQSCCCQICGGNKLEEDTENNTDNGFISCEQCERSYHLSCARDLSPESSLNEIWFCGNNCRKIFLSLQNLLGKPFVVGPGDLIWRLIKFSRPGNSEDDTYDIGTMTENVSKLNEALEVMHECFEPVDDSQVQTDLVKDVIFSQRSSLKRLDFKGFYTILLERNEEIISAATVRIFGDKVAELPLAATRFRYQRLGMFSVLLYELEKKLTAMGVERLVVPAVAGVLKVWTTRFGFSKMKLHDKLQFVDYIFHGFQDTIRCHKVLAESLQRKSSPSQDAALNDDVVLPIEQLVENEVDKELLDENAGGSDKSWEPVVVRNRLGRKKGKKGSKRKAEAPKCEEETLRKGSKRKAEAPKCEEETLKKGSKSKAEASKCEEEILDHLVYKRRKNLRL